MDTQISAGSVLINNANKVFLIYHKERDEWNLPKGHQEENETLLETAVRETKEETGYKHFDVVTEEPIAETQYTFTHPRTQTSIKKTVYFFLFTLTNTTKVKTPEMDKENLDGEWFTLNKAQEKVTYSNIRSILSKVEKSYL